MHLLSRHRESFDTGQDSSPRIRSTPRGLMVGRGLVVGRGRLADLTAAVLVAVSTALVVWAYRKAPTEQIQSYDSIFWAGMVLAYLAVAWRVVSGRHAVLWLGFLGLFTVLPKFWMSPNSPIYFDETAHYSLLLSIIKTGHLFQFTPLLPIGTFYPGLESMAATIHWLTGLSAWDSALTLIAVVHCLLPVQIYYIARTLPVPRGWAVVAGLLYTVNPSFIYDDVQFAYESVAILLMLTIVRLYMEALAAERAGGRTWTQSLSMWLLIAVLSFACVVTHHLTSLAGVGLLVVGALVLKPIAGFADRRGGWRRLFVRWAPVLTLAGCFIFWVAFVAPETVSYLSPSLSGSVSEIRALAGFGKGATAGGVRAPFAASTAPGYEEVAAIAGPVIIAVVLLFLVLRALWERRLWSNFLWAYVLSAAYLVSLPMTLVAAGEAGARRSWATTYVGIALLPPAFAILIELHRRTRWVKRVAATVGAAVLVVLLVGNVAAGTPVDNRFPGPYKFGDDTLSVTPETLRFADWVQVHLGLGAHIVTDRFTALALTAHAGAFTPLPTPSLPIQVIFYNRRPPPPSLLSALQEQGDDYLAVDTRIAQYVSTQPALFYPGEPSIVPQRNITLLAHWPWLQLLYSSQHYRLYKINFASYYSWYPSHAEDQ